MINTKTDDLSLFSDKVIRQMELQHEAEGLCIELYKRSASKRESLDKLLKMSKIEQKNSTFWIAVGRSGLAAKFAAMRETQIEIGNIYIAGDATTPRVKHGDVVMVVSISGETQTPKNLVMQYKAYGATVIAFTAHQESSIGNVADLVIHIPDKNQILVEFPEFAEKIKQIKNFAPLGTIPEQYVIRLLDSVTTEIMTMLGKEEKDLKFVHQIE